MKKIKKRYQLIKFSLCARAQVIEVFITMISLQISLNLFTHNFTDVPKKTHWLSIFKRLRLKGFRIRITWTHYKVIIIMFETGCSNAWVTFFWYFIFSLGFQYSFHLQCVEAETGCHRHVKALPKSAITVILLSLSTVTTFTATSPSVTKAWTEAKQEESDEHALPDWVVTGFCGTKAPAADSPWRWSSSTGTAPAGRTTSFCTLWTAPLSSPRAWATSEHRRKRWHPRWHRHCPPSAPASGLPARR